MNTTRMQSGDRDTCANSTAETASCCVTDASQRLEAAYEYDAADREVLKARRARR